MKWLLIAISLQGQVVEVADYYSQTSCLARQEYHIKTGNWQNYDMVCIPENPPSWR